MAGWLVLVLVLLAGCGSGRDSGPAAGERRFELQGQILAVRPETGEVRIRHGDIKGFMPAMTMTFAVKDRTLVADKAPGDLVTATLVLAGDTAWLSAISRTGAAPLPADAGTPGIPPAAGVTVLQPGSPVADTALTDQDNRPLALSAWRGSAVAITFMYTRCPLAQYCPLLDRRFADVQRLVQADDTLRGRVRLLSVSFDPGADTPAVLRAHAAKVGADPAVWRFATASPEIVDRLAATFGINVIREKDRTITHNLRTTVIDARGRVARIFDNNEWSAAEMADALRLAL
jgi:protein SCO1/2